MSDDTTQNLSGSVDRTEQVANILMGVEDDSQASNKSSVDKDDFQVDEGQHPELVDNDSDENVGETSEKDDATNEVENEQDEDQDLTWGKALGLDDSAVVLDDDGNLKAINVKVDGEVIPVDMKTLVDGYQINRYVTQKSQALSAERKEFEAIRDTASQAYAQKLNEAVKLTEYLNQKMLGEYQNIDWQGLRAQDPAEYAARIQDFQLKQSEISQIYETIGHEMTLQQQQQAELMQQSMQQFAKQQIERLIEKNPEWHDQGKMKQAFDELHKFSVESYGFTTDEFNSVLDARLIEMAKDAMAYRKGKKIADKKLEKPLPKFVKNSGSAHKPATRLEKLTKAAKNAPNAHDKKALSAAAIAELLLTG